MQRDDPMSDPPKAPEKSDYHTEELAKARKKLKSLMIMAEAEKIERFVREVNKIRKQNKEWEDDRTQKNKRYADMRSEVEAWEPPTPDHVGMKKFMLEQIDISMEKTPYSQDEPTSANALHAEEIAIARRDIEYHTEEDAKEEMRMKERADWIAKLYASLESKEASHADP